MNEATKMNRRRWIWPWWVWLLIALVLIVLAIGMFDAIFPGGPHGSGVHR